MRTQLKLAVLAAVLAAISCQSVFAAEIAVPANRESTLGYVGGVTDNCRGSEKPKMTLVKAPLHGAVRFQWTKYKIQNLSRLCNGKTTWGMAIVFKPDAGYRGKDSFTFGLSMPKYEGRSVRQYHRNTVDLVVK